MTLQDYISALSLLPGTWRAQPFPDIKLAWLGERLIAAHGFEITAWHPRKQEWVSPAALDKIVDLNPVIAPFKAVRGHWLPPGECSYCDSHRDDPMMPYHDTSRLCQSGKRPHCTCDACY